MRKNFLEHLVKHTHGKKRVSKFQKQGINKSAQIAKNQKRAISS